MLYTEITVAGKLDTEWSDWFDGLEISTHGSGGTTLRGFLPDQSAVFGTMTRLASLGLTVQSIRVQNKGNSRKEIP